MDRKDCCYRSGDLYLSVSRRGVESMAQARLVGESRIEVSEALRRAKQVAGGSCGYLGVCGAAAGAGIYMSVLLGSNESASSFVQL